MLPNLFAVVKNDGSRDFRFTKFYENYGEAKQEAERLCIKEGCEFLIIKIIAKCRRTEVDWEE